MQVLLPQCDTLDLSLPLDGHPGKVWPTHLAPVSIAWELRVVLVLVGSPVCTLASGPVLPNARNRHWGLQCYVPVAWQF